MKNTLTFTSKIAVFSVVLASLLGSYVHAENSMAAPFLEVSPSARQTALGGSHAAITGHFESLLANPASLSTLSIPEVYLSHKESFLDTTYETIGFGLPLKNNGLGIMAQYIQDSEITRTGLDASNTPVNNLGRFQPYVGAAQLTWSHTMTDGMAIGATGKSWSEHLDKKSYAGLALDLGLLHRALLPHTDLGVSLRNAGAKVKGHDIPRTWDAGLAYHFQASALKPLTLLTNYNAVKNSRSLNLGLEATTQKSFSLRAGYQVPLSDDLDQMKAISFGAGLKFRGWFLDYAWKASDDLGDTHLFSLTVGLGLTPEEKQLAAQNLDQEIKNRVEARAMIHSNNAESAMMQLDWDKAISEFNKSLTWNPSNSQVQRRLVFAQMQKVYADGEKLFQQGMKQMKNGQWMDATLNLQQAAKMLPENTAVASALADAKKRVSVSKTIRDTRDKRLQEIFNNGVALYINGKFEEATKEWDKIIEVDPNWPQIHEYQAKAKANILEQKLASQENRNVAQGQNIENLSRTAYTYYTLGQIDEAISAWQRVLILDPSNEEATWALKEARNKKDLGETAENKGMDRQVVELNTQAFQQYSSGNLMSSITLWRKALKLDPRNTRIKNNIQRVENELSLKGNLQ